MDNLMTTSFLEEKLHRFCQEGDMEDLKNYLAHGITSRINHGDSKLGDTPLHHACQSDTNSYQMASLLLGYGANPSALNQRNEAPVHYAARAGNLATLKLLIDKGGLSEIMKNKVQNTTISKNLQTQTQASTRRRFSTIKKLVQKERPETQSLISVACDSENLECIQYLLDMIMVSRRNCIQAPAQQAEYFPCSETFDIREFMEYTGPRQMFFFELGCDLASSNSVQSVEGIEESVYGKILSKSPQAFQHLLDNCIYTVGRKIYIDLFLFHNPHGSELNILKAIIHFKKYDLLTHPVCELFLHMKWLRSRWLYWMVMLLYMVYCLLVISYVMLSYGQLGWYVNSTFGYDCTHNGTVTHDYHSSMQNDPGSMYCIGSYLRLPLIISAAMMSVVQLAKLVQEGAAICSFNFWFKRPEEFTHFLAILLIIIDQFNFNMQVHRILAAFLVLASCRIMMNTIARDPDIAIFVEMVTKIQKTLFKFLTSYIWLFIGWTIAFYITIGEEKTTNNHYNSFHDIGSASAKILAMFTGELGFETTFSSATNLSIDPWYNIWIFILYAAFIIEMCILLMNLIIGLAISKIQDMKQDADALRLVKEVLLQRYMESLLRLSSVPFLAQSCHQNNCSLAQLVSDDMLQCQCIYGFTQSLSENKFTMHLVEREEMLGKPNKREGIIVPSTVVEKLKSLMQGLEKQREEMDQQTDILKLLTQLSSDIEEMKTALSNISK